MKKCSNTKLDQHLLHPNILNLLAIFSRVRNRGADDSEPANALVGYRIALTDTANKDN